MTFSIELAEEAETFLITLYSGKTHRTSLDACDCEATRYGRLCIHRSLIFAMGGSEQLKKHLNDERRKHLLALKAQATKPKEPNDNENLRSIPNEVPERRSRHS